MAIYLEVRNDEVVNAIVWDGVSPYEPDAGVELVEAPEGVGIGWTRENGEFVAPPEPVYVRYAVVKKLDGLVVDFKSLPEDAPAILSEPASFEYRLQACEDESVQPGWTFTDGEFVAP